MNGKTIAIVAGTAVGVFVLVKLLAPKTTPAPGKAKSTTDLISLNGLLAAGTALGGLFGGGSSAASAPVTGYTSAPAAGNVPAYQAGESFDDYLAGMFGPGIPTYD